MRETERVDDYTTSYLGYSTDNGAYYYGDAWAHNLSAMAAPYSGVAVAGQSAGERR